MIMSRRCMLGFYLFLGLYSSDVFAGEQSNPGPGLAIMCFRDSQCKIEPPSHLLTSAFNGEIKDCYPGSDPDNPALSCLTASLDYDWQDCAVSLYSDDHCKTNKTTAPVNKCMVLEHIGSFGIGCPSPTSARLVNPTKLQSNSQPSPTTSFNPVSQPSSQPASQPSSHSTSLPASQPSLTSGSGGGNSNNGGLSTSGTIAIGVVLPAVSVIVAIIFGVRMWNSGFPHRKGRDLSEVPMGNLGGNGSEPLKDSEQPFNEGPKELLTDPPVFGEPWKSPTTTAYSQVSVNTVPVYSPISVGHTEMYPHNAEALSPMSSMQTQSPWNLSRAQTPYYDTTTVNNSQAQYPQVGGVTELSAHSRHQPSEPHTYYKGDQVSVNSQGFAELPTEYRHTARQMPELSSHNDGYTRK